MANESSSKARVLAKTISGTLGVLPASTGDTSFTGGEGWKSVQLAAPVSMTVLYNIQTIDLSGYTIQDQTLFPQGVLMQDMDTAPMGNVVGTGAVVRRATMVSTTPITEEDLVNANGVGGNWNLPGSPSSTHNLQNILQGRIQGYLETTTFGGLQQSKENFWGSGDSTAAEKIWLCDAYLLPTIANLPFAIPDQAFVLPCIVTEEPELEYMMRLMRSLEPVY